MFLAPLNADRFFKKVFSDEKTAKRFLEDFLEIEIETIEMLSNQHKITDDAAVVEFDFRCKIEGKYVIIDMQQWYKKDIAQRFYMYHTANTVLQLEELSKKRRKLSKEEKLKKFMNYDTLMPAITLIWMVHDSLGYQDDYVAFRMLPEGVGGFIRNQDLWSNKENFAKLEKDRKHLLKLMNNQTKQMDFLQKSRLVYMFQRNIVKNKKMKKYRTWFEFAEKTRQSDNTAQEFKKYEEDDVFSEIIRKLRAEKLQEDEYDYIRLYNYYVDTYDKTVKESISEGMEKGMEKGIKQGKEEAMKEVYQKNIEKAKILKQKGYSLEDINMFTDIPLEVLEKLS